MGAGFFFAHPTAGEDECGSDVCDAANDPDDHSSEAFVSESDIANIDHLSGGCVVDDGAADEGFVTEEDDETEDFDREHPRESIKHAETLGHGGVELGGGGRDVPPVKGSDSKKG